MHVIKDPPEPYRCVSLKHIEKQIENHIEYQSATSITHNILFSSIISPGTESVIIDFRRIRQWILYVNR